MPLQQPILRALPKRPPQPPHRRKPGNAASSSAELPADSGTSRRRITASFHSSPQRLDTQRTFARKRPVIGFAGRTASEMNALRTIIYLPRMCTRVSISGAGPSHCPLPALVMPSGLPGASEPTGFGGRQTATWLPSQCASFLPPCRESAEAFEKKGDLHGINLHAADDVMRAKICADSTPSTLPGGGQAASPGYMDAILWPRPPEPSGCPLPVISLSPLHADTSPHPAAPSCYCGSPMLLLLCTRHLLPPPHRLLVPRGRLAASTHPSRFVYKGGGNPQKPGIYL